MFLLSSALLIGFLLFEIFRNNFFYFHSFVLLFVLFPVFLDLFSEFLAFGSERYPLRRASFKCSGLLFWFGLGSWLSRYLDW